MPSILHEALVHLFRNRPLLAPELLERALHVQLPAFAEARIEDAALTDVQPAEYHADLVVLLLDDVPVLGIVVEVQLRVDARKRFTWPMYAAGLRARFECPTCVLVVATDEAVADWARQPIDAGPGSRFTPLVVGPAAVPVVASPEDARRDPELTVLSALAHGRGTHEAAIATAAAAAVSAVDALDHDRALLYFDLIREHLGAVARSLLEDLMKPLNYTFTNEFYVKGRTEGLQQSLLLILRSRGFSPTEADEARVRECSDVEVLERWLQQAAAIPSIEALLH